MKMADFAQATGLPSALAMTIEQGAVFEGNSRRVNSIDKAKSAAPPALTGPRPAISAPA